MILTFEIKVLVPLAIGKKAIPYFKHLLNWRLADQGKIVGVICLEEFMSDEKAEEIEFEEWKAGRIDL